MSGAALLDYVRSAAALLSLPLDEARAGRVAAQLERTAALAQLLEGAQLCEHDEPAELYRSAPFPAADTPRGRA